MLDDFRMTSRGTEGVGLVESSHPGREAKRPRRGRQTVLCAALWTAWGGIPPCAGRRRDRPVESVGTTVKFQAYLLVRRLSQDVDNFSWRHAAAGPVGVSWPDGKAPLGASERSLGDVAVTSRRATWTGGGRVARDGAQK